MISLKQLKKKAERKYLEVLKTCLKGDSIFPLVIPADKKLPEKFEALHRIIGELVEYSKKKRGYGYSLTFEECNTRKHGNQSIPVCISFDSQKDFFTFIGRNVEVEKVLRVVRELCEKIPALKEWVENNPQKIIKYLDVWESISQVLLYFKKNPQPCMYTRELPIKVHTKFIERHKGILQELLDYIIPEHINHEGDTFEKRFHLKSIEQLIRIRRLDYGIDAKIFAISNDLALPSNVFNRLISQCQYVIITENQMTFLTLPTLENTIAIYGGGFKVESLKDALWLKSKTIIYWGDIDVHGFLILSLVRRYFPSAISVMMDENTFLHFKDHSSSGTSSKANDEELNLTTEELKLYRSVYERNFRLEQEHLPQDYIVSQLKKFMEEIQINI